MVNHCYLTSVHQLWATLHPEPYIEQRIKKHRTADEMRLKVHQELNQMWPVVQDSVHRQENIYRHD